MGQSRHAFVQGVAFSGPFEEGAVYRVELPPDQGDSDFVIQIWDPFGARVYLSRPGLPLINRATLGYDDLTLQGARWRVFSLQTIDGVIQVAQPWRVREQLAGEAALRVVLPLLLLLPLRLCTLDFWIFVCGSMSSD